jgi:hypothetical protein
MEVKPMDKLAEQLKDDAARIDARISDDFDRRMAASLEAVSQEEAPSTPRNRQRPAAFWWASSLTGVAAALVLIAIVNSQSQVGDAPVVSPTTSPVSMATIPSIDWRAESAMLTRPLQRELEDLQADLKKAEEKVKKEIGL